MKKENVKTKRLTKGKKNKFSIKKYLRDFLIFALLVFFSLKVNPQRT